MRTSILSALLMLTFAAAAAEIPPEKDQANRERFEKECAVMIAKGGPCGDVKKGGGGRRGCVAQPENLAKASPACKAVIEEWKALKQ